MNTTAPDAPASTTIDLAGLPEPVIRSIQQLVSDLRTTAAPPAGRPPLLGRFAHLKLTFSQEEIDEARRELWEKFPRDLPDPEAK